MKRSTLITFAFIAGMVTNSLSTSLGETMRDAGVSSWLYFPTTVLLLSVAVVAVHLIDGWSITREKNRLIREERERRERRDRAAVAGD